MIMMLLMLSMLLNMMFMGSTTPMSMLLIILIQTILSCMFSGNIMMNYLMSYILFLIFLGGLMVIFIYITSITSNEMFNIKMKTTMLVIIMLLMMLATIFYLDKIIFINEQMNSDMELQNPSNMEMSESIKKLCNSSKFMTMMMIYLMITMITVVKITHFYSGTIGKMY